MKNFRSLLTALCVGIFFVRAVYPDNKVITRSFNWKIDSTAHFDIYYYDTAGLNLLPYAETYLENAYNKVTKYLPRVPGARSPFFLYNNHGEFEESNIADIGDATGGVTEAYKNRFLISHTGSQRELEYLITHEYTHEAEFEYLFSGFWRSIRLVKFIFYPNWLIEGLAEYSGGDYDRTTREMYLRDAATCGKLLRLDELHGFEHVLPHQVTLAYKESEALMRFIADEYGENKLPRLLSVYRDKFDPNPVLREVLGTDLKALDREFREHLADKYYALSKGLMEPGFYGRAVTKKGAYPRFYGSAVFSPDGKTIAYVSDESGRNAVYLSDTSGNNPVCLIGLDKALKVESINTDGNALAFSRDGKKLYFCGQRLQKDALFACDLETGHLEGFDPGTDTAASPAVSPDGKTVYFSGMKGGFRNIFSIEPRTKEIKMLTAGAFDKIDAELSPDGSALAFSCERPNPLGRPEYDLCLMELKSGAQRFLTALPGDERYPCFAPDGQSIYFTSDADGVEDIYEINISSGGMTRLTRVIGGNFQPKISPDGKKLMFASFRRGEKHIYVSERDELGSPGPQVYAAGVSSGPAQGAELSQTVKGTPGRYHFNASTDLFFPVIFYSSLDGFFSAFYWQASDILGDHRLQVLAADANGLGYLNYNVTYGFLRYRPQCFINTAGSEYFVDPEKTDKKTESSQSAGFDYPLNRFQSLRFQLMTTDRTESWKTDTYRAAVRSRENSAGLAFNQDTLRGPYLEAVSGSRLEVQGQFSSAALGGDYIYQNYLAEADKFFPLGREHALLLKVIAGASFDRDAGLFRLGGIDRVRAIPESQPFYGKRLFVSGLEWRLPVVHNLNYHTWNFFPDFFFKTFYASLFVDGGIVYNDDSELKDLTLDRWKGSYGFALRFHTFIVETYDVLLDFEVAQRMDSPDPVFYFSAGTNF